MSDWYLWCPACDSYWTIPFVFTFPSVPDERCPRCEGKLKGAGVVFSSKPTAPLRRHPQGEIRRYGYGR